MDQKDKITKALNDLKLEPERYKKLQSLALSQMSDSQKHSSVYLSIQDLKMREIKYNTGRDNRFLYNG